MKKIPKKDKNKKNLIKSIKKSLRGFRIAQPSMLLFIPLVIGLDLLALRTIFRTPPITETGYLVSGLAFRYLKRKYPKGTFNKTMQIVKKTINLKYPTWPDELFPTVGGFHV